MISKAISQQTFSFQHFTICQSACAMKVGTDSVALGTWAEGGRRILDIGTGTGLLALMMAQRFPDAHIWGIDIDGDACSQATGNVTASPFANRITIDHCSLQAFHPASPNRFDTIISNPPYFVAGPSPTHLHNYSPSAGSRRKARQDITLSFNDLLAGVNRLLTADGHFSVIVPVSRLQDFMAEAYIIGLFLSRRCLLYTLAGKPATRVLLTLTRHPITTPELTSLTIRSADGTYTDTWQRLTHDFYL